MGAIGPLRSLLVRHSYVNTEEKRNSGNDELSSYSVFGKWRKRQVLNVLSIIAETVRTISLPPLQENIVKRDSFGVQSIDQS